MSKRFFTITAGILILTGGLAGQNADWSTTGNSGTDPSIHFLGTTDSTALEIKVDEERAMRIEPATYSPNIIGGSSWNSVSSGSYGNVISGGGRNLYPNQITDNANYAAIGGGYRNTASDWCSTIGGGYYNSASDQEATVGGGYQNTASGNFSTAGGGRLNTSSGPRSVVSGGQENLASGSYSFVGGGEDNTASEGYATVCGGSNNIASDDRTTIGGGSSNEASSDYSTVGGGYDNTASGNAATVAGGRNNTASGYAASVPGGYNNQASGMCSFATGYRAKANDNGSFVWGDYQSSDVASTGMNEFIVRANGGIWFGTNSSPSTPAGRFINTSTGAYLSTGGTWTNTSDKNLKEGFEPVDEAEILEKVAELPITTWNYKEEDASIQHMGPVAQDFHAAFGLGQDDKSISTVDASGVALAAIQALYKENQELKNQLEVQQEYLESLEARLQALENSK